jgi:hypothetical protein
MAIEVNLNINLTSDKVEQLLKDFGRLSQTLLQEIQTMATKFDDLAAKVTAMETVEASAIALLQGLKQKLDDAIATGDPAAIQQLSDKLGADTQALAIAVTANTPAEI